MSEIHKKIKHRVVGKEFDDDLNTHALSVISYIYNRIVTGAATALRKQVGLSVTEARIVFNLGSVEFTSANKLVKGLGLDKAAISRSTIRLIELGLIESERDPDHAGRNLLMLTAKGQILYQKIANFTFAREKRLLGVLTAEEHQQLLVSLRKIVPNVEVVNKLVAQGRFWEDE